MTSPFVPPTPEEVERLHALSERRLSPAEFDAYVNAPWGEGEREHTLELIAWFQRRYPTPIERLRAARRAMLRARRRMPGDGR
jgi:hypothetical protein